MVINPMLVPGIILGTGDATTAEKLPMRCGMLWGIASLVEPGY